MIPFLYEPALLFLFLLLLRFFSLPVFGSLSLDFFCAVAPRVRREYTLYGTLKLEKRKKI